MTTAAHTHTCKQVDGLNDEIRDLRNTVLVYATEDMRRAAIEAASRSVVAALRLPGNNPDVDADLALKQSIDRLVTAVDDAEDPHLTPSALVKRLRVAIDDPGMVLERYRGRTVDEPPYESLSEWQLRAVLDVLTRGVKAVTV